MPASIAGRLRNRPDSEHEQAIIRFCVGGLAAAYLVVSAVEDGLITPGERGTFWLAAAFFAGAIAIFAWIVARPGVSVPRRLVGMALDLGATTAVLALNGDMAGPVFPVYLWVSFGNGFRFGRRYLAASAVLSLLGFLLAVAISDFGGTHPRLLSGLVVGLVVLPLYVSFLLRKLTDALAAARAADEAKSRFLASMSHEIRTPLHGILGIVDALLDSPLGAEQRRYALLVHRSAAWLLEILDAVLDLSRLRSGGVTPVAGDFDLAHALEAVVEFHREAAGPAGPRVELRVAPGVPGTLRGDRVLILQVLRNLLRNAVQFTPAGRIELSVAPTGDPGEPPLLRFAVNDTGIGIPAEARDRVFEAFSPAEEGTIRAHGGTGLGLAISREIVRVLGGRIGLDSEPGRGTSVWFTVPLVVGDAAAALRARDAAAEASATPPVPWRGRPRVLVVEDNLVNRELAGILLARFGCDAVFAENGKEAVAAVEAGPFDLVLMDCQMPVLDGYAATRAIRERHPAEELPIVALTAYTTREHRERCREAGMDDFLAKPFDKRALFGVLTRWLSPGGRPAPSRFAPAADDVIGTAPPRPARPERAALHELANVLTGLLGYADLLRIKAGDERLKTYADRIIASGDRAREIVEELREG